MPRDNGTRDRAENTLCAMVLQRPGVRNKRRLIVTGIILLGLSLALFSACSQSSGGEAGKLPEYAYNSAETLSAYKIAQRIPDTLAVIPCYCGCGQVQDHKNLLDCFFYQDGSFNDHASNCHICAAEAVDVEQWQVQGLSLVSIRALIDAEYGEYGVATDTPPIEQIEPSPTPALK